MHRNRAYLLKLVVSRWYWYLVKKEIKNSGYKEKQRGSGLEI